MAAASKSRPQWPSTARIFHIFVLVLLFAQSTSIGCLASPLLTTSNSLVSSRAVTSTCPRRQIRIRSDEASALALHRRGVVGRTWNKCLAAGYGLMSDFRKTTPKDKKKLSSPFKQRKSLSSWGWIQRRSDLWIKKPYYGKALDTAFKDGKVLVPERNSRVYTSEHVFNYLVDGKLKPATCGIYSNVVNPRAGVIVADYNFGPSIQSPDLPKDKLPKLKNWSDLVFFQWADACAKADVSKQSLRYIFRAHIVNLDTLDIIARALRTRGRRTFPSWRNRVTLSMHEEAGIAILGTLHGVGAGFLLTQHKDQLGNKEISEVTVWDSYGPSSFDSTKAYVNLRFKVRPLPTKAAVCCEGPLATIERCEIKQYDLCYYRLLAVSM